MPKYEHYTLIDWEAIYIDGLLAAQGHPINLRDVLSFLGIEEESQSASEEAILAGAENGDFLGFPETLDELVSSFGVAPS